MSHKALLLFLCFGLYSSVTSAQRFLTKFEQSSGRETVTYEEGIAYYQQLAEQFPEIQIRSMGKTDSGKPLHLVIYSRDKQFDVSKVKEEGKPIFMINNAIHPGESDGVDASMMFLRDLAQGKILKRASKKVVFGIIPFYNIGGVLNRNSTTRANQNGPIAYGFRGNARNFDLNRDFIKGDSRNAWSFWEIFHLLDPDFFLDTHVSNGADYQYAITLIATQKDKLSSQLRPVLEEQVKPSLYAHMEKIKEPMTPFVNVYGRKPDGGFSEFADWPRYSSGYAALFNTISFMSETHMLKPYKRRVNATYQLMIAMAETLSQNARLIIAQRKKAKEAMKVQAEFPVKWQLDRQDSSILSFKGYEGTYVPSEITSQPRLYYDKSRPFERDIAYKNTYEPSVLVKKPKYYVLPQGWHSIADRLRANGVLLEPIEADTLITVNVYHLESYETVNAPYEGHYFHYNPALRQREEEVRFAKGDYLIPLDQSKNRYIVETLEPAAEDSFFKWNFFDTILGAKEGFSSYVFEDIAVSILADNPAIKSEFEQKQQKDEAFRNSRYAQLRWIYERSPHREKEYLRYPVYRLE